MKTKIAPKEVMTVERKTVDGWLALYRHPSCEGAAVLQPHYPLGAVAPMQAPMPLFASREAAIEAAPEGAELMLFHIKE